MAGKGILEVVADRHVQWLPARDECQTRCDVANHAVGGSTHAVFIGVQSKVLKQQIGPSIQEQADPPSHAFTD